MDSPQHAALCNQSTVFLFQTGDGFNCFILKSNLYSCWFYDNCTLRQKIAPALMTCGVCVCAEGPRSRCYGRTAALRLIVQPCDEDEEKDDQFFSFFQVMEHRWNEIDRRKPKYSVKNLSHYHFFYHKSHMDRPGIEPVPPR